MSEYIILTDTGCDLPASVADELGLSVVPLIVNLDGTEYLGTLDEKYLSTKEFYAKLRAGASVKTSAANIDTFINYMEPIVASGRDVLYLGFSSGLSATYSASVIAAETLAEKYPDRKIITVDTLSASLGQGLLVYLTAKEKLAGKSIDDAAEYAENMKMNICHWFTVGDLQHLYRGGRVSKTAAVVGTVLNIKPILQVDNEGHLINVAKVRGTKAYLAKMISTMRETGIDLENQEVFISHGDAIELAEELAECIKAEFGVKSFVINPVGPVIGSHSGPETLALFFIGTTR